MVGITRRKVIGQFFHHLSHHLQKYYCTTLATHFDRFDLALEQKFKCQLLCLSVLIPAGGCNQMYLPLVIWSRQWFCRVYGLPRVFPIGLHMYHHSDEMNQ